MGLCRSARIEAGGPDDFRGTRSWAADGDRQPDSRAGKPQQRLPLENGAGVKINHVCTLTAKVNEVLGSPERLASLRAAAKKLDTRKPRST